LASPFYDIYVKDALTQSFGYRHRKRTKSPAWMALSENYRHLFNRQPYRAFDRVGMIR